MGLLLSLWNNISLVFYESSLIFSFVLVTFYLCTSVTFNCKDSLCPNVLESGLWLNKTN